MVEGLTKTPSAHDGEPPNSDRATQPALRPVDIVLSLIALFTLSVAQPLLDILGRNAPFFVAHDSGRLDVIALAIGLTLIVPLAVAVLILLLRAASPRLGTLAHTTMIGVLVTILALVTATFADLGGRMTGWLWIMLAVAVGVAAAVFYLRHGGIRRAVNFAAVAAPVVAGLFLFASPVSALVFPDGEERAGVTVEGELPPIVFVIFDELPTASLLDENLRVDREWYPELARFTEDATLYRNFTTVHEASVHAVPAAVSGRVADPDALPNDGGHPTNMFALLGDHYRVRAVEPLTDLCPDDVCDAREGKGAGSATSNVTTIRDLGIVAAHLVVPEDMAARLPPVDASWRDFGEAQGAAEVDATADEAQQGKAEGLPRNANHPREFRRFTARLGPSSPPTLDFLHIIFPHRPWRYLPTGQRHTGTYEPAQRGGVDWVDREWPVEQGYQLHLAQVQLADVLIGELMDRLRRAGIYDDALIVLTADHGIDFTAGEPFRNVTNETFGGVAPVPLFIKEPEQVRGGVDDTPMQSTDLLPTMLDLIGADAKVDLDGESRLGEGAPPLRERLVYDNGGASRTFPADAIPFLHDTVQHKLQVFGETTHRDELYQLAPPGTRPLLGRALTGDEEAADALTAQLARPGAYEQVVPTAKVVPAHVKGRIVGAAAAGRPLIAISLNGRIAAVTRADLGDESVGHFRALMAPSSLREGRNDVQILLVEDEDTLKLIPRSK